MRQIWHDLECGAYRADLPLWRALADQYGDPVLELGAGSGRVALHLARRGHRVTALDHDPELITALRARAGGLPVDTVVADARGFSLSRQFALCLVPMQTIQLLGGADGRARLLHSVKDHLSPGGAAAIAIAEHLEPYRAVDADAAPPPDVCERNGTLYRSQAVEIRRDDGGYVLERRRQVVRVDGAKRSERDLVRLDHLTAAELVREGAAAGLTPLPTRSVAATREYVGSAVAILGA